jgi:hypothetical protein
MCQNREAFSAGPVRRLIMGIEGNLQAHMGTAAEALTTHLEAAVAAVHARAASVEDTDWSEIVWLYNILMAIRAGSIVALNRAVAIAQKEGPEDFSDNPEIASGSPKSLSFRDPMATIEIESATGRGEVVSNSPGTVWAASRRGSPH